MPFLHLTPKVMNFLKTGTFGQKFWKASKAASYLKHFMHMPAELKKAPTTRHYFLALAKTFLRQPPHTSFRQNGAHIQAGPTFKVCLGKPMWHSDLLFLSKPHNRANPQSKHSNARCFKLPALLIASGTKKAQVTGVRGCLRLQIQKLRLLLRWLAVLPAFYSTNLMKTANPVLNLAPSGRCKLRVQATQRRLALLR